MFSGLANLLFGSTTNSDTGKENENPLATDNHESPTFNCNNLRLISCETDEDDWLIVEREEKEGSLPPVDSEEELPFVEIKRSPTFEQRPSRHQRSGSSGSCSSLSPTRDGAVSQILCVVSANVNNIHSPIPICMEESWFLTPPPCFTSRGPINMESSPFENLLIEHPSMSVYHSIRSAQEAPESFVSLDLAVEESQSANRAGDERVSMVQQIVVDRRNRRFVDLPSKHGLLQRNSQKDQTKKERQNLRRNALERNNKVRDLNSKNNRQGNFAFQQCKYANGAKNNRKC